MPDNPLLSASEQTTYNAIFRHPVSRDLEWREVRSMLIALADAVEERGDTLKVTRNGHTLVVRRPSRKGMGDIQELMKVRHFLAQAVPVPPQT